MARLLLVHHTSSPTLQAMFEAVLSGTAADGIEGVEVEIRPALTATAPDVLAADGYLLGSPANIGYMSGAPGPRRPGGLLGARRDGGGRIDWRCRLTRGASGTS